MPRVKRGTTHTARRKRLLKKSKGFKWGRKSSVKLAKTAVTKAGVHAYKGRKQKKRDNRAVWQVRINAAVRPYDLSYSRFINLLKKNKVEIDRKVLSEIAAKYPKVFEALVKSLKK